LVSPPVTSGFVSAAAVLVMVCNVKTYLGLSDLRGHQLIQLLPQMAQNLYRWVPGDFVAGVSSVIALNLMQVLV
jgi:MFS superfamily sulfate permease-like transporter